MKSKIKLKKLIGPLVMFLIGILLIGFGFMNDPLWPPQDMTLEVAAAYKDQRERADGIYLLASSWLGLGAVWFIGAFLVNLVKEFLMKYRVK